MLSVQQFLTKNSMTPRPHSSYSANRTPSDFSLFLQIKEVPKGKNFANVEEVKQKTAEALKDIKIDKLKN